MKRYIARRLVWAVVTLVGVSVMLFLMLRVLPGDVAQLILIGEDISDTSSVTDAELENLRQTLGLDKPLVIQYFTWIGDTLQGDLGNSLYTRRTVVSELNNRFRPTLQLTIMSMAVVFLVALPAGLSAAVWHNRKGDYLVRSVAIAGITMPSFWVGILILLGLVNLFHWSPPLGYQNIWEAPIKNLQMMIWPALTLGFGMAAINTRMLRSSMLEVLRLDYITTARAKGLGNRSVLVGHALRNAILPVITLVGLEFTTLISGVVVMEKLFAIPGLGSGLFDSIIARDYPMVQSLIFVFTIVVVATNLTVDLLYGFIDPRIRYT